MNSAALHLNLMKESEVRSSSPVRLRVMMPMLAMLATVAMLVWWGMSLAQYLLAKSVADSIDADNNSKQREHSEVIGLQQSVREKRQQLEQLEYYRAGVRAVGKPLAALAEAMPVRLQLTSLSITRPPPQNLQPKGPKGPQLWGPQTNTEEQKFVVSGRARRVDPVTALVKTLDGPGFEDIAGTNFVAGTNSKANFRYIQEEENGDDSARMITFEIEYAMPERRFGK